MDKALVQFELDQSAQDALSQFGTFSGLVKCTITFPNQTENSINSELNKMKHMNLSVDERTVFDAWNNLVDRLGERKDIAHLLSRNRNKSIDKERFCSHRSLINSALKKIGVDVIVEAMASYYNFVCTGKQRWDELDHSYKDVIGLLKSMLKHLEHNDSIENIWWMQWEDKIEDENSQRTLDFAQILAACFYDGDKTKIKEASKTKNPSKQYRNLMNAAKEIESFHLSQPTLQEALPLVDLVQMFVSNLKSYLMKNRKLENYKLGDCLEDRVLWDGFYQQIKIHSPLSV